MKTNLYGNYNTPASAKRACFYDPDCQAVIYSFSEQNFALCKENFAMGAKVPCCSCVYKKKESYGTYFSFCISIVVSINI